MARINTYELDTDINGGDRWIGSDSGFYNKTKNFTPVKLADYFNNSESINQSNTLRFRYQTLDPFETRSFGTISFENEIGSQVPFSDISEVLLSKKTEGNIVVSDFLLDIGTSKILLHKSDTINEYGVYIVNNIEEDLNETDFLKVSLSFIQGNGSLYEDNSYFISVVDFEGVILSDKNYLHNQALPLQVWNISHNLGKYPSVSVILSSGQVGLADVIHIDENNLIINFSGAESGKATLN